MIPGFRFSFYNPRETVYKFDRVALSVLYSVYRQYGVIPNSEAVDTSIEQSALIHFAIECEAKGLDVESFLGLIENYRKGLMNDEERFSITL